MKGDFSRLRFDRAKHYSAVLKQQGRVELDADANEQSAIDAHLRDTTNVDVIGPFGGPIGDAGFAIEVKGDRILIGPGRYYVDGILVENPRALSYDDQPYLIDPSYTALQLLEAVYKGRRSVTAGLYLEVWERLVTELDDPCLREPALGQADTTVRLQTVWRVVAALKSAQDSRDVNRFAESGAEIDDQLSIYVDPDAPSIMRNSPLKELSPCCQSLYDMRPPVRSGAMSADTAPVGDDCGCQPIPAAGYLGLENQLYRVEIQSPGNLDQATFKWSRENGSVVTAVTDVNGQWVTVSSLGPDVNLGFQAGQWVELSDDTYLFAENPNQPGDLYQIMLVQQATMQVKLATPVTGVDPTKNARMRRWDQGAAAPAEGIPLSATPIPLENGIEVTFRTGEYVAGDYWTIPARTATGYIEWPPCGGDGNLFRPARFTRIHRAPLACIQLFRRDDRDDADTEVYRADGIFTVNDCRLLFPPLTALSADVEPAALHISGINWKNDDVMTVDTLLANGLYVTLDQAPTCPWSGGNFRVTLEAPLTSDTFTQFDKLAGALGGAGKLPDGTDIFLRSEYVLDPLEEISVSGKQVTWLAPAATTGVQMYPFYGLWFILNLMLSAASPRGYGRVRIKLAGGAVYADGANGNIYLDGQSFGSTETRSGDGSDRIDLAVPSGNAEKASDFDSWFYLAPTLLITDVQIQAIEAGNAVSISAVTVVVNSNGAVVGLNDGADNPTAISAVQALITLSYAPVADTPVTLMLTGPGVGTVVTIPASVIVPSGQISVTVPINILSNPGGETTDTVSLQASVATVFGNAPFNPAPTLAIVGQTPPEDLQ